jgi:hypothetical protein
MLRLCARSLYDWHCDHESIASAHVYHLSGLCRRLGAVLNDQPASFCNVSIRRGRRGQ